MFLRRVVAAVASLAFLAGVTHCPAAQATTLPTEPAVQTETLNFRLTANSVEPRNAAARQAALNPPLNNWQFRLTNARLMCLLDFTPEVTTYNPRYTAYDWSQASPHLHMNWDDMNGDGSPGESRCTVGGGFEEHEVIRLYTRSLGPGNGCADAYITRAQTAYGIRVFRAELWINRTADAASCRASGVMRQNMTTRLVGYALGLGWTGYGESVMATPVATRNRISGTQYADKVSIYEQYKDS